MSSQLKHIQPNCPHITQRKSSKILYSWLCSRDDHLSNVVCWWTNSVSVRLHNFFIVFLTFDFCQFCVVIPLFYACHNGQWPPTSMDFYPRCYPLHFCPKIILKKEPVFSFSMLSAKQGNYWYMYHFYNIFDMTRYLTGDRTEDLSHSKRVLYH